MFVERIFIRPKLRAFQEERDIVEVQKGLGIVGDRHFALSRHTGENVTLVEAEEIELWCEEEGRELDLSMTRRNLVTRGARLSSLVGVEFMVGAVRLRGIELCEPCVVMARPLSDDRKERSKIIARWARSAGLRADALAGGEIARGAPIEVLARKAY